MLKLKTHIKRKANDGKVSPAKRICGTISLLLLCIGCIYLTFTYSNIPFIKTLRHMAIETSLSTMRHQWVASALFPDNVVDEVWQSIEKAREEQVGISSTWEEQAMETAASIDTERQAFFELFWELDERTVQAYLLQHPAVLHGGWSNLCINEAGLEDEGTSILTIHGDPVLAVDAKNQVLLIRVSDFGYRGVLAIAKDPSRLSIQAAQGVGHNGQLVGEIALAHDGILAMTASGFLDIDENGNKGMGNGGIIAGFARCDGVSYGAPLGHGFKRVELRSDDLLYIVDSQNPVHEDCTDAAEFTPALIVDGDVLVDENCGWNAINPRACIGQNDRGEIMMLSIEGRQLSSLGIGVVGCAEILSRYNCVQAMNLDGGTSAILWYDSECVTRCSNEDYPEGRPLPTAFVYRKS